MGKASRRKRERRAARRLGAAIPPVPDVVKGLPFPGRLFNLQRLRAAIRRSF